MKMQAPASTGRRSLLGVGVVGALDAKHFAQRGAVGTGFLWPTLIVGISPRFAAS
jgi:hypothetical protein